MNQFFFSIFNRIQPKRSIDLMIHFFLFFFFICSQVKQGGRGMKTAYKDLKSKISDRTPPKHSNRSSSMASTTATPSIGCHHSAPNSPVFSKRPQSDFISISNSSMHRSKPQKMLQTSNSMINNSNLTKHFNNNITINSNKNSNQINKISCMSHDAIQTSPTATRTTSSTMPTNGKHINSQTISKSPITIGSSSPTSSISSTSEMNILQELQQHALFKISTVDQHVSLIGFKTCTYARTHTRTHT